MRPTVALVTEHWGEGDGEPVGVARLLAGAIVRHAEVAVLHLVADADGAPAGSSTAPVRPDSVFAVHRIPVHARQLLRAGIVRAALAATGGDRPPASAAALLQRLEGETPDLAPLLERLAPDTVVMVGHRQPTDLSFLSALRPGATTGRAARLVVVPLLGTQPPAAWPRLAELVDRADVALSAHPGERRNLEQTLGTAASKVRDLDLALSVNRSAVRHRLFGVRHFGHYVVMLRGFPPSGARHEQSVTHELAGQVLGVAVAEVDLTGWRIADDKKTLPFPVNPSRVNLWRLMAHAEATLDLRPPGPLGRETLESLLFGTPVLVPDESPAMEHARAADGGLWYRDFEELFAAAQTLLDRPLREALGSQGFDYALRHHGRMDDFVERTRRLVLGG